MFWITSKISVWQREEKDRKSLWKMYFLLEKMGKILKDSVNSVSQKSDGDVGIDVGSH